LVLKPELNKNTEGNIVEMCYRSLCQNKNYFLPLSSAPVDKMVVHMIKKHTNVTPGNEFSLVFGLEAY
jgi:hypothetical protein